MRIISFKIDEKFLEQIDLISKWTNKSRSEIIREALSRYVSEYFRKDDLLKYKPRIEKLKIY